MKIIFFGSDDFAATHLEALIRSEHKVVGCVTQPDKPKGRGMKDLSLPVKDCARDNSIRVLQPADLNDDAFLAALRDLDAEMFVVIAYGRILSSEILAIPKKYAVNVHGSLLPKYRGAAPINWAIINGDVKTGVSIIKMNKKMDAGEVIAMEELPIGANDTSSFVRAEMAILGSDLLLRVLKSVEKQAETCVQQNEKEVTFAPKLTRELGKIDWSKSAIAIHNLVRGLLPWPGAYTEYQAKTLKIISTQVIEHDTRALPGEVVEVGSQGIVIATGKGVILVKEVHLQSSKPMDARSFTAGHKIEPGFRFG